MIAPLRRRHRLMTAALLVVVPVFLVLAVSARRPEPVMEAGTLPEGPDYFSADYIGDNVYSYDVFGDLGVRVRGGPWRDGAVLELAPGESFSNPDLLVYWSLAGASERLPVDAVFLGALGARARYFVLPWDAATRDGNLVLYSLGHQEVVASGALPALVAATPAADEYGTEVGDGGS